MADAEVGPADPGRTPDRAPGAGPADQTGGPPSRRTPGRGWERPAAFGLLALGSLLGLLLATQNWWIHPAGATGITGNQATASLAGVLAGAAAAGTGLAALSGWRARTVLGVLLAALGVGMVAVGITASVDASEVTTGPALAPGVDELAPSVARWIYLVCGPLVTVGAAVLVLRARTWPARRDRFARVAARGATTAEDDAADVWKAMDAGFDPTSSDPTSSEPGVADPASSGPGEPGQASETSLPPDRDPSGRKPSDRGE